MCTKRLLLIALLATACADDVFAMPKILARYPTESKVAVSRVYVANWQQEQSSIVEFIERDGVIQSQRVLQLSSLFNTSALAIGPKGELWFANGGASNDAPSDVEAINTNEPAKILTTIRKGIAGPDALAFDAAGNLYVANSRTNTIAIYAAKRLTGDPEPSLVLKNKGLIYAPSALAFDRQGNLWVANVFSNTIVELQGRYPRITARSRAIISKGLIFPYAITFDCHGNLWVANWYIGKTPVASFNSVVRYSADKLHDDPNPDMVISQRLYNPSGIAFDSSGHLWVTNGNNTVTVYSIDDKTHDSHLMFVVHSTRTLPLAIPFGITISPSRCS